MEKMLLNPNCSEIVCKLPFETMEKAKEEMEKIGVVSLSVPWYITFDDEAMGQLFDKDNPNSPDFENSAHLYLQENFEGEGIFVVGHQHCQHQLYATVKKIEDATGEEFGGYDGGYDFKKCYTGWRKRKTPVADYQMRLRKVAKALMDDKELKADIDRLFSYKMDHLEPRYMAKNKCNARTEIDEKVIQQWIDNLKAIRQERTPGDADVPIVLSEARKRYIILVGLVTNRMRPKFEEIVKRRSEESKKYLEALGIAAGGKWAPKELTAEDMKRFFDYEVKKIAAMVYILAENKDLRDIFLDEKWFKGKHATESELL
jgi:hypothetical protein